MRVLWFSEYHKCERVLPPAIHYSKEIRDIKLKPEGEAFFCTWIETSSQSMYLCKACVTGEAHNHYRTTLTWLTGCSVSSRLVHWHSTARKSSWRSMWKVYRIMFAVTVMGQLVTPQVWKDWSIEQGDHTLYPSKTVVCASTEGMILRPWSLQS